ncbi:MAG: hypothetical protein NTX38_13735, partial [Methylobacter sp.]|nr:hypothetical protein [Methylobacter sp.]
AVRDITNTGASAHINLNQVAGTVSAGRDLLVDTGGTITATNVGNRSVSVGRDMMISGSGSLISFNNIGNSNIDVLGTALIDNGGKIDFANTGTATINVAGDLTVGQAGSGQILRSGTSSADFIVDPISQLSHLIVKNSGSAITDSRTSTGNMKVSATNSISVLNGGLISREGNSAAQLILDTPSMVISNSKVTSSGSMYIGSQNLTESGLLTLANSRVTSSGLFNLIGTKDNIFTLSFDGGGSWITSTNGNFGIDGQVFYTLPAHGLYGNVIGSEKGSFFIAPNNLTD